MIQLLAPCASVDIQARTLVPLRLYRSRWCSSARRWQRVGRSSVCGGICEYCVHICGVNDGYCRGNIHSRCGRKRAALLLVVVVSGCRPLWLVVALVLAVVMQVEPEGSRQLDLDYLLVLIPLLILMVSTSMFARLNPQAADLSDDLLYCGEVEKLDYQVYM